jgi:cell division septal protein FtsQ
MKQYRKPHRYKKRKPFYYNRFLWLALLVLVLSLTLFYFLFLADLFQIKEINVAGLQETLQGRLKLLVQERTENNALSFPTRSIFLVNTGKIKEDILKEFPSINKIEIGRNFPDSLDVSAVERKGLASLCQGEACFILDREGIVFENNGGLNPLIRTLIFGGEINLGDKVIEENELRRLLEINSYLEMDLDIAVKELVISSTDKLIVLTQEGWEIYLNPQGEIEWQLTKLRALLNEKIPQERRGELEWIELRFSNFANPKYKD